jgi:iron complex transport system substrate-binding protein
MRATRRPTPVLTAALLLTGCASGATGTTSGGTAGASAAGFPRTVAHLRGRTAIRRVPSGSPPSAPASSTICSRSARVPAAATRAEHAGLVPDYLREAFPKQAEALGTMTDTGTRTSPT